jgi:hypothetical protein
MKNAVTIFTALACLGCLFNSTIVVAIPPPFTVCTDFHCETKSMVSLSDAQWGQLQTVFQTESTPAFERENIRKAIAMFEKIVGYKTGTWHDLGMNYQESGQPGELDCISESINTTTYLGLLQSEGLLRWHEIEKRQQRRLWIFGVHWAAVIRDKSNGARYAVDSWRLDNGEPPYVQRLELWLSGQSFE